MNNETLQSILKIDDKAKDNVKLIEEKNKEGYYKGHTQNYILVEYKTDEELENKIVKVNIKKAEVEYVIG